MFALFANSKYLKLQILIAKMSFIIFKTVAADNMKSYSVVYKEM